MEHIIQDRDGFIWLSHGDGITKFDGYNFKLYSRRELGGILFLYGLNDEIGMYT